MSFDRRNFLKLLGAGGVIAPVINGVPAEGHALIVEPPKVEIIEPNELKDVPGWFGKGNDVTIFCRNRQTGLVVRIDSTAFLTHWSRETVNITTSADGRMRYLPGPQNLSFQVTGYPRIVEVPKKGMR